MKTAELIDMLAAGGASTDGTTFGRRMGTALAAGLSGTALMLALVYGIRSDMPEVLEEPLFWMKVAFPLAMLLPAQSIAMRLARPGMKIGATRILALAAPLAALWLTGIAWLMAAPPSLRLTLILGSSWQTCSFNVALLSLPTLGAMFWALHDFAPTRPAWAGATAGLVAGAQGLLLYTLYCIEMAPPFWGVWYVLGMLIPVALGALGGRFWLRW